MFVFFLRLHLVTPSFTMLWLSPGCYGQGSPRNFAWFIAMISRSWVKLEIDATLANSENIINVTFKHWNHSQDHQTENHTACSTGGIFPSLRSYLLWQSRLITVRHFLMSPRNISCICVACSLVWSRCECLLCFSVLLCWNCSMCGVKSQWVDLSRALQFKLFS